MAGKRLISYPYMMLRAFTAGMTLVVGLLQTFVFARVMSPERFSLFIFVAAVSYSLYLADGGIVKVLFVNLRRRFLQNRPFGGIANHATVVVGLYFALAALTTLLCFIVLIGRGKSSSVDCVELALFFSFNAINLPWLALRNISIAIDDFFYIEALEASRRTLNAGVLVALLFGLPLLVFLLIVNAGWVMAIFAAVMRLRQRRAIGGKLSHSIIHLLAFFRSNGRPLLSSAAHMLSETYIYNFTYFLVPWVYGLGAPTIIFDTANKIFRSNYLIYSAICDLFVPRQTRAFNDRDARTLVRATLLAMALGAVPLISLVALLIFFHERFFALLLGPAAVMPPEIVPVLVILLTVGLAKMVAYSVLIHCGFFTQAARLGPIFVVAMTAASVLAIVLKLDIVGFMSLNAAGYTIGTMLAFIAMIRGPIHSASQPTNRQPVRSEAIALDAAV
jgi:O-antigen/teichoic acid export membrane protein